MSHKTTLAAISAVAVLALAAVCCILPASDAESTIDQDLGEKWGYRIQFVFNGADAEGVEWDFGDGSEVSSEWNPLHTYPKVPGKSYTVTQIAWNHYGLTEQQIAAGERVESIAHYKITIMGDPVISFETGDGSDVADIDAKYNQKISAPADPTNGYHRFLGWYKDSQYKQKWDFNNDVVTKSITLYAAWEGITVPTPENDKTTIVEWVEDNAAVSVTGAFAILALAAGLYTRNPRIIILAVILAVIAAGIYLVPDYLASHDIPHDDLGVTP